VRFDFGFATLELKPRRKRRAVKLSDAERVEMAYEAALWFVQRADTGKPYSRRKRPRWMTQPQWKWGRTMAHSAGVMQGGYVLDKNPRDMNMRLADLREVYLRMIKQRNYSLPF
jgi:hypothetical protein